jgi:hypothetical membrane protein|tara:strand:+ start:17165 stop:17833 length:669 start_codon:yes stop_codon:yes gene_type:complete
MRYNLGKTTRIMLLSYLGLLTLAAFFYGGGNYVEKQTPYYNFFKNFISDLGRTTSHSGDDNSVSIVLFSIGMFIQLVAVLIYLVKAADFFSVEYPKISLLAKLSAFFGSISLLGVVLTPADVPALYSLHIFFANSVFNGALLTLGIYSYLFYSKGLKNVTYTLLICSIIILGYIIFLEVGPAPWKSIESLTIHATYQKIAVLSLVGTVWAMSRGTDLLDDKV